MEKSKSTTKKEISKNNDKIKKEKRKDRDSKISNKNEDKTEEKPEPEKKKSQEKRTEDKKEDNIPMSKSNGKSASESKSKSKSASESEKSAKQIDQSEIKNKTSDEHTDDSSSESKQEKSKKKKEKKVSNEKEFKIDRKEGTHLISEVMKQNASTTVEKKESTEKNKKTVSISIRNDRESGTISSISDELLKKTDKTFGTTLLEKSKGKVPVDTKKIEKSKETEESLKRLTRADQILKRLTLSYSRNKDFKTKTELLIKTAKKLTPKSIQRIFLHILNTSDNPYVVLYVLERFDKVPPFISDACAVQLALFLRTLKGVYLDAIPYSKIIRKLFGCCILSDVTVEHSYDVLSQIEQDSAIRALFIDLFGRIHIINYYKELCAGLIVRNISRNVLYSVIYTINDKGVAKENLSAMFRRLDEYCADGSVEKNTVTFARAIWALLTVHMDVFDEQFDTAIKYIGYFCGSFTESSCEFFSVDDALEIIETIDILANAVINRTIKRGKNKNKNKPAEIKNYVQKKEVKKTEKPRIIPEMENVSYSDNSEDTSDEDGKSSSKSTGEHSTDTQDKLNNVSITREKLLVFTTLINTQYKDVCKRVENSIKWQKRPAYETLLYAAMHIKLLHLLLYLSRISGSSEIPVDTHYKLYTSIDIPPSFDAKKYDGTQKLADRILCEKWHSLGFLLKEGLITSVGADFSRDILRHKSPVELFGTISASVHLLSFPPPAVFLENGHIYDFIYLQTLPKYILHKDFVTTLKKTVRTFISQVEKEALTLLIRRLIELDGFYTEREEKKGSKTSQNPNNYAAVKHVVRDIIASLFITEMDLSVGGTTATLAKDTRLEGSYDTIDAELREEKVYNPVTKQEEYKISEEIVFKRFGTDMHKELSDAKAYHKSAAEGKHVDEKRRKIVFDFIITINDLNLSDKFIKALVKLDSVLKLTDNMLLYVIKTVAYSISKLTLSEETVKQIKEFAQKQINTSESGLIKGAAKYLFIRTTALTLEERENKNNTYDELVISLLLFITTKQGNLGSLKDSFFNICPDLKEYERNELLLLFSKAGVKISKTLTGHSEELERYKEVKNTMCSLPALE